MPEDEESGTVEGMPLALFLISVMVKGVGDVVGTEVEVVIAEECEEERSLSICLDCLVEARLLKVNLNSDEREKKSGNKSE